MHHQRETSEHARVRECAHQKCRRLEHVWSRTCKTLSFPSTRPGRTPRRHFVEQIRPSWQEKRRRRHRGPQWWWRQSKSTGNVACVPIPSTRRVECAIALDTTLYHSHSSRRPIQCCHHKSRSICSQRPKQRRPKRSPPWKVLEPATVEGQLQMPGISSSKGLECRQSMSTAATNRTVLNLVVSNPA
jgi:hypothetical protein